jgi:citrate lyase subunit beta-like protein
MNIAHSNQKGAFGLEMEGGGKEMIDAPMLKQVCVSLRGQGGSRLMVDVIQAENVIRLARAAGCDIPHAE